MPDFTAWLFAGIGAWLILVTTASILYRRARGKPVMRPDFSDALFLETWRSGVSRRSLLTLIGQAQNCLWVAVTADELRIGPHFPFTIAFLPELYGLDLRVRPEAIRSVERHDGLFGRSRFRITFYGGGGWEEAFDIHVADADAFAVAIESLRVKGHGFTRAESAER